MRKRQNINSKSGFTIIEVVLVLAIAGLIMMMVFIALPGLQRSQRDTQRTNDMSRVAAALAQYQSNNRGKLPGNGTAAGETVKTNGANNTKGVAAFYYRYLYANGKDYENFKDPDGNYYNLTVSTCSSTVASGQNGCNYKYTAFNPNSTTHPILVYKNAQCTGTEDNPVQYTANSRKAAVTFVREGGGVICVDV